MENFSKGLMFLSTSGNYIHKSKFLPGAVEKNSSTIRSSGRNRTYAALISTRTIVVYDPYSGLCNRISKLAQRNFTIN